VIAAAALGTAAALLPGSALAGVAGAVRAAMGGS
jgi:hypothetical protein